MWSNSCNTNIIMHCSNDTCATLSMFVFWSWPTCTISISCIPIKDNTNAIPFIEIFVFLNAVINYSNFNVTSWSIDFLLQKTPGFLGLYVNTYGTIILASVFKIPLIVKVSIICMKFSQAVIIW